MANLMLKASSAHRLIRYSCTPHSYRHVSGRQTSAHNPVPFVYSSSLKNISSSFAYPSHVLATSCTVGGIAFLLPLHPSHHIDDLQPENPLMARTASAMQDI